MKSLSPFVYWAQTRSLIFLKVDLKDVKQPSIHLESNRLDFQALGVGADGQNNYEFSIDFFKDIHSEPSCHKVTDNNLSFAIRKCQKEWWPRLTIHPIKPVWLKVDYDRFHSEEIEEEESNTSNIQRDYPQLYDELQKMECGYRKEDFRTVYLTLYNLFMFVGFAYVMTVILIRVSRDGPNGIAHIYGAIRPAICFLQLLQLMEVLHPLFGYTKGNFYMPLMQISGRIMVLFANIEMEPRIQVMPVTTYLIIVWSFIELIRYPYYISELIKRKNYLLTWLRYSAWIICYPAGFMCEGVIIVRNIMFLSSNELWTKTIMGITVSSSHALRFYLTIVTLPAILLLMRHMHKVRKQKFAQYTKPSTIKKHS